MSSIAFSSLFKLLLRDGELSPDVVEPTIDVLEKSGIAGIRCPLCKWRPKRGDVWICWTTGRPEWFSNGCGTAWNTFMTGGICPTCRYRWKWTACLRCTRWSKHEEWYDKTSG